MIDELKKSVSANLYERLTSPLIGSYVVSWCLWNYKVLLIILSSLDYDKKIEKLDAHFSGWIWFSKYNIPLPDWICLSTFIIPLLGAVFYIFLYPFIAKYVFKIWQKYIADKEKIRQNVKKDIPITKEQADKLRQDIGKQSVEFENRLNDKNERIKTLEERDNRNVTRIDEKDKEIKELKDQLQKLSIELSGFLDRKKMIEEYGIKSDSTGKLQSGKGFYQHRVLCPSCFNASPPKLTTLPDRIPYNQQFLKCPSCAGEYYNENYEPAEKSKIPPAMAVDNEFLCWIIKLEKRVERYCPPCVLREGDFKLAKLAEFSENEYKCVLCSKSYLKTNNHDV